MLPHHTATQLQRIAQQITAARMEWQDQTTPEYKIPARNYFAQEVWQAECSALFRQLPLIAAHSSEIAPGQVLAHDAYELPILLTRDAGGEVKAFLNVCRHRGMRLVSAGAAQPKASLVCPYHGWTYKLSGQLRHIGHADSFDACAAEQRNLVALPCEERHGLVWVLPDASKSAAARFDLSGFLAGMDDELPFYEIDQLTHFRTVEAEYPANWKLIIDAFLEAYHIRVLHKDTIYPFFTDGITAAVQLGPHSHSLVARRAAQEWAGQTPASEVGDLQTLRQLVTPSQVIFPNTVTIFHPDYLSLITLYPSGPQTLRWTHRMLIPKDKATPDWSAHWEKTFNLIEKGVFQREDIASAVQIQRGFASGANEFLTAGRMEQGLAWFHSAVAAQLGGAAENVSV